MNTSHRLRAALMLGMACSAAPALAAPAAVQFPDGVLPPPVSAPRARYFQHNPSALAALAARLPRAEGAQGNAEATPPAAGPWTNLPAAPAAVTNPLLLTDGTVLVQQNNGPGIYRLTPDAMGNYATGSWSTLAPLPKAQGRVYAPLYHASAVLPDGRVIFEGGEYNGGGSEVFTNQGAIYDPVANLWTAVAPPAGAAWKKIGDAQSVVLADGLFMLASCCANPAADALLNPKTLTWLKAAAPNAGGAYQDEQGYTLLPNHDVLTIDIWTLYASGGNADNAERYVPAQKTWVSAGTTPVPLADPVACGNYEIGPAVLRANGDVVAFGGNTGCVTGAATDPTAIYAGLKNSWSAGPSLPSSCGTSGTLPCTMADAPAALLPDGNILIAASAGYGLTPAHFFELSPANVFTQVTAAATAQARSSYNYTFLLLPSGQVLVTDQGRVPELYTPTGAPLAGAAPVITSVPATLSPGTAYTVAGSQLGGVSAGAYYGDDAQSATNYPIVRVTNSASGVVTYARSYDFTQMSLTPGAKSSASFVLPAGTPAGAATLQLIANGVASAPVAVTIVN